MPRKPMKKAPESVSGRPNIAETYKPSGMRRCDMNGNNKQIFIVISQTGTVLSRILKRVTGAEYNHASLSLSPDLKKMYSFGRRHPYNPFWGGFVIESPHAGTFRRFSNTTAVILAVEITEERYAALETTLETMWARREQFSYNLLGLLLAFFRVLWKRSDCYYCSEFVEEMLLRAEPVSCAPASSSPSIS